MKYNKKEMENYKEEAAFLEEVPKFTEKNSLDHTKECLRRLNDPQESFRILHVAGTNGKGSTCAFLDSILREAGYSCGLFTSPHLVSVRERFCVNGRPVSEEVFLHSFQKVKKLCEELTAEGIPHPTYFEMLFLMGMVIFAKAGVEYCVLETGLGGRLDATTAAGVPQACVITSVSRDHMQYLGETIPEIAGEKAGILVEHVPVIYDASDPEAARVIEERAALLHCPTIKTEPADLKLLMRTKREICIRISRGEGADLGELQIPFPAKYQMMNAALAVRTILTLRERNTLAISDTAIKDGLKKTCFRGRMQEVLPGVFLDGAHNEDGIRKFTDMAVFLQEEAPLTLLFAAVDDKEYENMIHEMLSRVHFQTIVVTQAGGSRQVPAQTMAKAFERQGCLNVESSEEIETAFTRALDLKGEDGILLAAGSLYLVGEILRLLKAGEDQ